MQWTLFQNYNDYSIQKNQTNTPGFVINGLLYTFEIFNILLIQKIEILFYVASTYWTGILQASFRVYAVILCTIIYGSH